MRALGESSVTFCETLTAHDNQPNENLLSNNLGKWVKQRSTDFAVGIRGLCSTNMHREPLRKGQNL